MYEYRYRKIPKFHQLLFIHEICVPTNNTFWAHNRKIKKKKYEHNLTPTNYCKYFYFIYSLNTLYRKALQPSNVIQIKSILANPKKNVNNMITKKAILGRIAQQLPFQ